MAHRTRLARWLTTGPQMWGPLFEHLTDGVVVLDTRRGGVLYANPTVQALTGPELDQLMSAAHTGATPPNLPHSISARSSYDSEEHTFAVHHGEVVADGLLLLLLVDLTELGADGPHGAELREAVSAERVRIARDLHDGAVQSVFSAALTLAAAETALPVEVRGCVTDSIEYLEEAVQQLRCTLFDLDDTTYPCEDASELLHAITARASRALGFAPSVRCSGDASAARDPDQLGQLRHAAVEILSNIARHARASMVDVAVHVGQGALDLVVIDNGAGLDEAGGRGAGLRNLVLRAEGLGGTCTFASSRDVGTLVRWSVPLRGPDA